MCFLKNKACQNDVQIINDFQKELLVEDICPTAAPLVLFKLSARCLSSYLKGLFMGRVTCSDAPAVMNGLTSTDAETSWNRCSATRLLQLWAFTASDCFTLTLI